MAARAKARRWHLEDIKAELVKQHGRLTRLSVDWGYARGTLSAALGKPERYPRVCRRVAKALDEHPHTLWPDHYSPPGESQPRTVNTPDRSRRPPPAHRQKGAVA